MPLLPATLASNLQGLTTVPMPTTAAAAAAQFAGAYHSYASAAVAGVVPVTLSPLQKEALAAAILPALAPATGNAATLAAAITAGVTAYWAAGIGTAVAGAVVVPPVGVTALPAALSAVFALNGQPASTACLAIATALHTCTLTTTATFPGATPVSLI